MKTWTKPSSDDTKIRFYMDTLKLSYISASIVYNRFTDDAKKAVQYIKADTLKIPDPFLLKTMDIAVKQINRAIERKLNILIWGDEDGDGITATATLYKALQALGANTYLYIPERSKEGIGLNSQKALEIAQEKNISLIITVDCGSRNLKEAEELFYNDLDLIITDHHIPGPTPPRSLAFINPKFQQNLPELHALAGVGVAFYLAIALIMDKYSVSPSDAVEQLEFLLPFVTLGTISDRVPLEPINRYFINKGLEYIRKSGKQGIWKYIKGENIFPSDIAEIMVPVINTAKGGGENNMGIKLLLENDETKQNAIFEELHKSAIEWKKTAEDYFNKIKEKANPNSISIIYLENIPSAYIGYLASRLTYTFGYPAIVMTNTTNGIIGEARSDEGIDMLSILEGCRDRFTSYGGHKQACGFSAKHIMRKEIENLIERLFLDAYKDYTPPPIKTDVIVPSRSLSSIKLWDIHKLAPFGDGFDYPIIYLKDATITHTNNKYYVNGIAPLQSENIDIATVLNKPLNLIIKTNERYTFTLLLVDPNS